MKKQGPESNKALYVQKTDGDLFGDEDNMESIYQLKASLHVMQKLNDMRENGEFYDLILELSNTKFLVHQNVIALWSPVLKNLLQCREGFKQHVHIHYDKPNVFRNLLSFLYRGAFADEDVDIPAIMLLATTFEISLLQELCVEHMMSIVTPDNVISLYHNAVKYQLPDLKQSCIDIMQQQLSEVAQSEEFRNLSPAEFNFLLGTDLICGLEPELKLCLIISWLSRDVAGRRDLLVHFLGYIDWSVAAAGILEEISQTENIFTSYPEALYLLLESIHASSNSLGSYEDKFEKMKEQYCYLPKKVVSGEVVPAAFQADVFRTVDFALVYFVSHWNGSQRPSMPREINWNGFYMKMDKSKTFKEKDLIQAPMSKRFRPIAPKPQNASSAVSLLIEGSKRRGRRRKRAAITSEDEDGESSEVYGYTARTHNESMSSHGEGSALNLLSEIAEKVSEEAEDEVPTKFEIIKGLLKCSACKFTTEHYALMEEHYKKVHLGKCRMACDLCSFSTKWDKEFYDHLKEAHFPGPRFECDNKECSYSTEKIQAFLSHRTEHGNLRPYTCDVCLKAFRRLDTLNIHLGTHPGKLLKCNVRDCDFTTSRGTLMKYHMQSHEKGLSFPCDYCGKTFVQKQSLTLHLRVHKDSKTRKFLACTKCEYLTMHKERLKSHYERHHSKESTKLKAKAEVWKTRREFSDTVRAEQWKVGRTREKISETKQSRPTRSTALVRGRDYKKEPALPSIEDDGLQVMVVKSDRLKDLVQMQW